MSDFDAMTLRLERTLADLAEAQDRLSNELARSLVLSTGMIRDLGVTLTWPRGESLADEATEG
jgi:hypothetical protein